MSMLYFFGWLTLKMRDPLLLNFLLLLALDQQDLDLIVGDCAQFLSINNVEWIKYELTFLWTKLGYIQSWVRVLELIGVTYCKNWLISY